MVKALRWLVPCILCEMYSLKAVLCTLCWWKDFVYFMLKKKLQRDFCSQKLPIMFLSTTVSNVIEICDNFGSAVLYQSCTLKFFCHCYEIMSNYVVTSKNRLIWNSGSLWPAKFCSFQMSTYHISVKGLKIVSEVGVMVLKMTLLLGNRGWEIPFYMLWILVQGWIRSIIWEPIIWENNFHNIGE